MNEGKISSEDIIEKRKEKIFHFLKKKQQWIYYIALAFIVWFSGIFIRTANISRLKDITTGKFTLAPDLDPFLFLRMAKYILANGSLAVIDTMRYAPLGFNNAGEMTLPSYIIAYLYKFLGMFSSKITVEYAAIIYPIIFFCATIIVFFMFVKKLFSNYRHSNLIALVSTAILSIIPSLIHRTVAGVPEKESAGLFFMFLTFYFIACAINEKKSLKTAILGLLAGISTGIMGMVWGGVEFLFVSVALAYLLFFFFNKIEKKDILSFALWIAGFTAFLIGSPRFGISLFSNTTSGLAYFVLLLIIFDKIIFNTKISERLKNIKLPRHIVSLIGLLIIGLIFALILEPGIISNIFTEIMNYLIKPLNTNRLAITVAENSRPFVSTWLSSFGGSFFWVFILGSAFVVYELFSGFKLKNRIIITLLFFLFVFGSIFSRYSSNSILNGGSFLSSLLFIGSIISFIATFSFAYIKKEEGFNPDKNLILIVAIFFFSIILARSAIRLFYFIVPIAPIMAGFFLIRLSDIGIKMKNNFTKIMAITAAILILVSCLYSAYIFMNSSINEAKYSYPGKYEFQWQKAMEWVRTNTAEDAIFAHWWDYGYWVQTLGERPTVVDGGNAIAYWNYLVGRHVLTAQNETEALEFLKTHNTSYLLIDSTDIGKYTAFSSIGSDENNDRYGWIATFTLNEGLTQEKRNETMFVFTGGTVLDEDIIWENKIYPMGSAGINAIVLPVIKTEENSSISQFGQPFVNLVYKNNAVNVPIKCVYIDGTKIQFESKGIDGCFYMTSSVSENKINKMGGGFWLSNKLMNSLMVKLYILNETTNFEIVHTENDPIIEDINSQGYNLPEITFYGSNMLGPIKIWKINYPEEIKENPEYLKKEYPNENLFKIK